MQAQPQNNFQSKLETDSLEQLGLKVKVPEKYPPMPMIVGSPRSGTTLLRLMLDAHPELSIPPETHFIRNFLNIDGQSSIVRQKFYEVIIHSSRWSHFNLSKLLFKEELEKIEPFTITDGLRCFYQLYAARFNKKRWGDKTPFTYNSCLYEIQKILPEARFIHLIRDGRDVALSMKDLWWRPHFSGNIEERANRWLESIQAVRQQAQSVKYYKEVYYEELVSEPRQTLKKICIFVDIAYSESMMDYYRTAATRLDEFNDFYKEDGSSLVEKEQLISAFKYTSKPPEISRIGRWKQEMSEDDLVKYEAIAGSTLRDLGYETQSTAKGDPEIKSPVTRLEEHQANLERSRLKLQQFKANLSR